MAQILVVDDSSIIRRMVVKILSSETGYTIDTAISGEEALETIKTNKPDLIILDVEMKGMNGFQVLEKIRNDDTYSDVNVIMLTSLSGLKERVKGLNLGASDYIMKPFDPTELLARIKTHIRVKELQDKLIESEKRSLIAQMVITLRHEINNPLTIVLGNIDLLLASQPSQEEYVKGLKTIRESAKRIDSVIQKISEMEKIVTKDYATGLKMIDINQTKKEI